MKKTLFIASICLSLTACGFEPMYGKKFQSPQSEKLNIASELETIEISNIPNYEGQYLRNALIDRFYPNARAVSGKYVLNISPIQENTVNLDITKSSNATRAQLHLKTRMSLIDKINGEVILSRDLGAISSYNVLTSEFATRVSAKNMRENTLDDLAHQIELQIGLHFRKQANTK